MLQSKENHSTVKKKKDSFQVGPVCSKTNKTFPITSVPYTGCAAHNTQTKPHHVLHISTRRHFKNGEVHRERKSGTCVQRCRHRTAFGKIRFWTEESNRSSLWSATF